ncbi:MAG: molybdenum cofactor biosynthesis F family protein [Flavobacteriaceae bacterium]|nr:molybdenum cofactor biosynthesis F family protein [Flavobacteriaceae bacterium]
MDQKTEWITVGSLAEGFKPESFILPNVTELSGKIFFLYLTDTKKITYTFTESEIIWQDENGKEYKNNHRISSIRNNIYFIDFINQDLSFSTVLDLNKNVFTTIIGTLPTEQENSESLYIRALNNKELTFVTVRILQGTINTPYRKGSALHKETNELIGMRNLYRYSPTEIYEHIYLNQNFYTWHCIKGVEAGLADTDRCHYYKIDYDLYLFIWREKIIPTLGIVIIDMQQHRSDGKIFGYETGKFTNLVNFPVSSHCSLLNTTNKKAVS